MAQQSFSAAIDDWVRQTEQRVLEVFRTAAQFVIDDVVERSPVDTGFMRASLVVSLEGPVPLARENPGGKFPPPVYDLEIAGAELGSTIYASFGANYAAHVEYGAQGREGRGMVRLAAQAWPQHVQRATAEAKSSVAANARSS